MAGIKVTCSRCGRVFRTNEHSMFSECERCRNPLPADLEKRAQNIENKWCRIARICEEHHVTYGQAVARGLLTEDD